MDRTSLGVFSSVSVFVASLLASSVLMRAAGLLPESFDRNAFLVRYGSGPLVGLGLLVVGLVTFCVCRAMIGRLGMRRSPTQAAGPISTVPHSRSAVMARTARFAASGVGVGLISGAVIAWILIRVDGMGNGGDTSIVQYEIRDLVQSSLIGVGVFLVAALTVRLPRDTSAMTHVGSGGEVSDVDQRRVSTASGLE